jgi:hypothetical protein
MSELPARHDGLDVRKVDVDHPWYLRREDALSDKQMRLRSERWLLIIIGTRSISMVLVELEHIAAAARIW